MPDNTTRLGLPYILPSQAQKHVTHNEALQILDGVVQLSVLAFGAETPPATPAEGEVHALGANPSGDWSGQANMLAIREETAWRFIAPAAGWRAWGVAEGELRVWAGAAWEPAVSLQNLPALGIGTTADASNPLSVAGPATLLTHDGAGHQLKLNKAGATDTASLLFQTGWTGHAEIGLTGDDNLHLKVSPDGSAWTDALIVDGSDGTMSGAAVQSGALDAGAGKLLRMEADRGPFDLGSKRTQAHTGSLNDTMNQGVTRFLAWDAGATDVPWSDGVGLQIMGYDTTGNQLAFRRGANPAMAFRATLDSALNFSPWMVLFHSHNLVGPVGEAGGIPTGAAFEAGTNANGRYVRFADGTQICTHSVDVTAIETAMGALYTTAADLTWTFPASFSHDPNPSFGVQRSARAGGATAYVTSTSLLKYRPWLSAPLSSPTTATVKLTAIGRWY